MDLHTFLRVQHRTWRISEPVHGHIVTGWGWRTLNRPPHSFGPYLVTFTMCQTPPGPRSSKDTVVLPSNITISILLGSRKRNFFCLRAFACTVLACSQLSLSLAYPAPTSHVFIKVTSSRKPSVTLFPRLLGYSHYLHMYHVFFSLYML